MKWLWTLYSPGNDELVSLQASIGSFVRHFPIVSHYKQLILALPPFPSFHPKPFHPPPSSLSFLTPLHFQWPSFKFFCASFLSLSPSSFPLTCHSPSSSFPLPDRDPSFLPLPDLASCLPRASFPPLNPLFHSFLRHRHSILFPWHPSLFPFLVPHFLIYPSSLALHPSLSQKRLSY